MTKTKRVQQILSRLGVTKFVLMLFIGISFIQTSCNKSSEVGLNVQPSTDLLNVNYIDTTTLVTKTVKEDSLRTDQSLISEGYGLLGKYIDPVFGTANSSLYTQVRLPSSISSTSFGTSPVCDSIVLSLVYDTTYCYGKKTRKTQTVNVYELLNGITSGYNYSNTSILNKGVDLANAYSFIPRPQFHDSITILGVKSRPQLRIPLNKAFGDNLLNNTGNLIDNATFQNFMKGFYITTENTNGLTISEGNIMRFLMASSSMTLYYHNSLNDSLKFDFSLGSVSRNMHFSHDYSTVSNVDLASQLSSNPPSQNSTVYIQSMAGLKTKVEMPTLMNWVKNGPIAINKAELVLKVDNSAATYQLDTFAAPNKLIVYGINDDGGSYLLPDYIQNPGYFNYTYNSITHEYHLIISRYIQQVLDGARKNNGLYITLPNITITVPNTPASITANRVIIGGGASSSAYQMKLNISYTKLH